MAKTRLLRPTNAELEILKVLWSSGPGTVRQVHAVASRKRPMAYNTVLTFLQIMVSKGLAVRDEDQRPHVYRPALPEERTKRELVNDLLDRVFGGSMEKLVAAVAKRKVSGEELAAIRQLVDKLEDKP